MSDGEVRLYVIALLAAGYLGTWHAIARPPAPPAVAAPAVVWLDALPPDQQPLLEIPRGWQLAVRDEPTQVARVPAGRPLRVRTRSS